MPSTLTQPQIADIARQYGIRPGSGQAYADRVLLVRSQAERGKDVTAAVAEANRYARAEG